MITVPRMASVLRTVFEKEAPILARQMGVIQRNRKVNGTSLLLLFVLGWLHQPKAGSSALARFAGTLGVTISKQGIEEHWTFKTADWQDVGAAASRAVPDHSQSRSHPALATVSWGGR